MSKKKYKSNGVYLCGYSAQDVTGSQYYVKYGDRNILLECGLHQSSKNSYLESYKINAAKFKFDPAELDYVFINHTHIDHIGLIPRLVKEGFRGKIIATSETAKIMKPLLMNSCFIIQEEAKILSKKFKREYKPIYDFDDVNKTMELVEIYDSYNTIYHLDDEVSFQWFHNSHCIGAAQLQLILGTNGETRKILYTSDIGALHTDNHYVTDTDIPTCYNDVVIMESTYGAAKQKHYKTRKIDVEHFKTAIDTVLERGGSVILPCFSFSRTQEILTTLYDIYGQDENFKTDVVIDSKLSCEISELYLDLLDGENRHYWNRICHWENVRFITEKEDSKRCLAESTPKIILSSSGFCTNGRIINYLKKYLRDSNSMIIFSGYIGDNPSYLSYRIKNFKKHKTISIFKEDVPNRADCMSLSTFSSHANYNDLITYGSSLNTSKLVLVHGSAESKKCLADGLRKAISERNKTFRVISSFMGMVIHL